MGASIFQVVALFAAGLFAGGAMMQTLVDHPARMAADSACGLDQMQRTLRGADPYMPALAVTGSISALLSFVLAGRISDIVAAAVLFAVIPFTLVFIVPINKMLLSLPPDISDKQAVLRQLRVWARLHAIRSLLGVLSLALLASAAVL